MPRCDDCGNKRCSCVLVDGDNTAVLGSGSKADPYRVNVDIGGAGGTRLVGEIIAFAGGTAPTGWLICDGAAVSRTTYAGLFAILGSTYGAGDGSTTFNLPDLAGRFPLGADGSHARGSVGGQEEITLATSNLPVHSHTIAHNHAMDHAHNMAHAHTMDHAHGDTGSAGSHHHTVNIDAATIKAGTGANTSVRVPSGSATQNTSNDGAHTHTTPPLTGSGTSLDVQTAGTTGGSSRNPTGASSAADSGNTGGGLAHTNMPPYTAITFIVKT